MNAAGDALRKAAALLRGGKKAKGLATLIQAGKAVAAESTRLEDSDPDLAQKWESERTVLIYFAGELRPPRPLAKIASDLEAEIPK